MERITRRIGGCGNAIAHLRSAGLDALKRPLSLLLPLHDGLGVQPQRDDEGINYGGHAYGFRGG